MTIMYQLKIGCDNSFPVPVYITKIQQTHTHELNSAFCCCFCQRKLCVVVLKKQAKQGYGYPVRSSFQLQITKKINKTYVRMMMMMMMTMITNND